jgi:steroid delta-isomerase-like uncharacterized protein
MDTQQAIELVERYNEATNTGNLDEFDNLFAKEFINIAAGFDPVNSLEDMKKLIRELLDAFLDWGVTVNDIIFAQHNKVVVRWSLKGTHLAPYRDIRATSLTINAEGIHIYYINNGKIAKRWACNTFAALFAKLKAHDPKLIGLVMGHKDQRYDKRRQFRPAHTYQKTLLNTCEL